MSEYKMNAAEKLAEFKKHMSFKCWDRPPLHHPVGHKFYQDLLKSKVLFHTQPANGNGFYGCQFIFPNKREARKAAEVMGKKWEDSHITCFWHQYGVAYYG